jgi:hypothetical protein
MRKAVVLLVGLAFVMGFSGLVFAGGGDGLCSYQQQAKQVAVERSGADKSEAAQTAATQPASKSEVNKVALALESINTAQPAETQKK